MSRPLARVVVFTDAESAYGLPHLAELMATPGCDVVAVVAAPARATERPPASILDRWGQGHPRQVLAEFAASGAPVLRPRALDPSVEAALRALRPAAIISAGFRRLIPRDVLQVARVAAVNFHPSRLSRVRGADPWFWTLLQGERDTAVSVHHMTESFDAGDVAFEVDVPIAPDERAATLFHKTVVESLRLVPGVVEGIRAGGLPRRPQGGPPPPTRPFPRPSDARIDWRQPADRICRLVRAASWTPGAWTTLHERRIVVTTAEEGTDPALDRVAGAPGAIIKQSPHAVAVRAGAGHVVVRLVECEKQTWNAARLVEWVRCGHCPDAFV